MRKSRFAVSAVGVFLVAFLAVGQAQNQNTITTVAGGGPNNLSAISSSLGTPWAVVQDSNGNTYISDNLSNRVFKVDGSGNLTVVAGNIINKYNQGNLGDGQLANTASLNAPEGIALDSNGILYIADTNNNAIRVVNTLSTSQTVGGLTIPAGVIETIAGDGSGTAGYTGDGGPATSALLNAPGGVWLDGDNNIYVADTGNSVVRVVNTQATAISFYGASIPAGDIQTIVGNGTACNITGCGDGSLPTAAELNFPDGIFVTGQASLGNVVILVADTLDNRVRAVNTSTSLSPTVAGVSIIPEVIVTIAGDGTEGYSGDGDPATTAELNHPSAVVGTNISTNVIGAVDIADGDNLPHGPSTSNEIIRQVNSSNTISTIAGTPGTACSRGLLPCGDGSAANMANLWAPTGVFVNGAGSLLIADQNDDAIREVSGGNIQTLMGALLNTSYSPFPVTLTGTATDAALRQPAGVAADAAGNIYIADTFNNAIRKVDTSGTISTFVGTSLPCKSLPCGDGNPAGQATVTTPFDIAFDNAGNLYIADSGDNTIRVVNNQSVAIKIAGVTIQPGVIFTVAGNGVPCSAAPCGDAHPATSAELNSPEGVFVDSTGNIFIADTGDNAIREVNSAGTITTVAGAANPNVACAVGTDACGDGGPATSAQLNGPGGVGLDSAGNIYIADTGDNRVRVVSATAKDINAFAGTGAPCTNQPACLDGGPALQAVLDLPQNLIVDFAENVFIADSFDYEVREVTKANGNIQGVAGNQTRGFSGDGNPATMAQLAVPFGLSADSSGNIYIADFFEWRVRKVTGLAATAPTAQLSKTTVTFSAQALNTKSASVPVTLSNDGSGANLTTTITITGTNKSDFAETDNCASVPGPGSCTINITMTPSAAGALTATLMVTDNASGSPQTIALSGTGQDFSLAKTGTLSNPSVSAGGSANATITIAPGAGLAATVDLTCAVTPATTVPPTCALNPTSLTPGTTKSTLTVSTAAAAAALVTPSIVRSAPMYAIWLLLPGMLLSTAGASAARRRKLLGYFLIFFAIAGCLFLVGCGGGGSSTGGGGTGGGTPGTTAGSYTVTVTAKTSTTTATQTLPFTVE
jgi:trimeric autotransporter adhesin